MVNMDRRQFLQSSIALSALTGASSSLSNQDWKAGPVEHLIPSANHSHISLKAVFSRQINDSVLLIDGKKINGRSTDSTGRGFAFDAKDLRPNTRYELALMEGETRLTDSWFQSTMPDPKSRPEHLRLLVFGCATTAVMSSSHLRSKALRSLLIGMRKRRFPHLQQCQ